jgi:hypothetical protein
MTTPLEALSSLSRQDPTPQYFVAFHEEVQREKNDRGAAILLACHVEICLRYAIHHNLVVVKKESQRLLFHTGSPLISFEAKIRIGYSMGMFGKQTKVNLDCIKGIRNAFAHAVIPLTFETPQIMEVCKLMVMPEILPPRSIRPDTLEPTGLLPPFPTPRQTFQKICEALSHNLFLVGTLVSRGTRTDPKIGRSEARTLRGPLP